MNHDEPDLFAPYLILFDPICGFPTLPLGGNSGMPQNDPLKMIEHVVVNRYQYFESVFFDITCEGF